MLEESTASADSPVTKDLVYELAKGICKLMADADPTKSAPDPAELTERFLRNHGLLLSIGNRGYKFAHRSFQEFLAGQFYAAGAHHEDAVRRAGSLHWREPFRLMASFSGHQGENLFYVLQLIESLTSGAVPSPLASLQLGAEMLTEIGRRRLALRGFGKVIDETEDAAGAKIALWPTLRSRLAGHVENPHISLPERERSAAALGLLGDPRVTDPSGSPVLCRSLISLPPARVRVGSFRLSKDVLATSGGFIDGERFFEFNGFKIGRYPVTNAEYRHFVDEHGYTSPDYWRGKFANGWLMGDASILRSIREHWLVTVHEHHAKEIRDGEIDLARLEEDATVRTEPRQAPFYWEDRRFNMENQPVVGVNWWEASAYCEWATRRAHQAGLIGESEAFVLPTEFEWERATRPAPDDRIFPWGDEWSDDKAHVSTNLLNMRKPCPIGVYLEPWSGAPCDLAGNVWEWTASLYLPYAEEFDGRRLDAESFEERVVRGSSWYNKSIVAACSARAIDRSYNLFYDVGFRVALIDTSMVRAGHYPSNGRART
jgi:formylglycine-generating enzyme required for sulfatase activity